MRFPSFLISVLATLVLANAVDSLAAPLPPGTKYVLLDVPYTAQGSTQSYTTPQGEKADPWTFSHGLLTLVQTRPEFSEFRDIQGRILRVNTPDGQLRGLSPVSWEAELSRAWRGRAWAYGSLNYACRLNEPGSVNFQLLPGQALQVAQVYRIQGTLPGVSHRNTFGAGTLFTDEPVEAVQPLLIEFSAPGWKATGGGGSGYLENTRRAPSVCRTGFLPLLDQGGLDRNLSHAPLASRPWEQRWKQPQGQAPLFYRGWTKNDIRIAFGSPDEPGTLAQLNALDLWTYAGPMAEFYRFTFRAGRVVRAEEGHMP